MNTSKLIASKDLTLHDLEQHFQLQRSEAGDFFPEWQGALPPLTGEETAMLNETKAAYLNLITYPLMLENAVQITVVSPLLHVAGSPPFHLRTEVSMRLSHPETDVTIEGRIDILVVEEQFWVVVIESKRAELSIKVGMAQILAYMLANPNHEQPCFGLITNGGSSVFLKLTFDEAPVYGMSRVFDLLNPGNDLWEVARILKYIRQLALKRKQVGQMDAASSAISQGG